MLQETLADAPMPLAYTHQAQVVPSLSIATPTLTDYNISYKKDLCEDI